MTIDIPDAIAERLRTGAERTGLPLNEYMTRVLDTAEPAIGTTVSGTTKEERLRRFEEYIRTRNPNTPVLDEAATTREHIYDRDSIYEGRNP